MRISRRGFVGSAAAGLGAAAALGGRAVEAGPQQPPQKQPFDTPPPAIPRDRISSTVPSDVVVVGAGIAGLIAALSAAEAGATVTLIEKAPVFSARGGDNTAINSRLHERAGIRVDEDRILHDLMKVQGARIHHGIVRLWMRHSARTMNWVLDMVEAEGLKSYLVIPNRTDGETFVIDRWPDPTGMPPNWDPADEYTMEYPTCHRIGDRAANQRRWLSIVEKRAIARGARVHYRTKAVRLIRDDRAGRVSAVIAQDAGGKYIEYTAAKGVVLSTGDYSANPDMIERYFPGQGLRPGLIPTSTGEGHQMAMWVGAVMEKTPHAPLNDAVHALGTDAFLLVNSRGQRFCNEDLDSEAIARQAEEQHGCWLVVDASWPDDLPRMGLGFDRVFEATPAVRREFQEKVAKGAVLEAPTVEGLAAKMKVPAEALKRTLARYNELVKGGRDLDFGKRADRLTAVDAPPFYAQWNPNPDRPMLIFGGLLTDERLQAVDAAGRPIDGLFLAGNTVGGRFKQAYPLLCPGISHGMAATHGFLAGRYAMGLT